MQIVCAFNTAGINCKRRANWALIMLCEMYSGIISTVKQYKRVLRGWEVWSWQARLEFITRLKSHILDLSFLLKVFCRGGRKIPRTNPPHTQQSGTPYQLLTIIMVLISQKLVICKWALYRGVLLFCSESYNLTICSESLLGILRSVVALVWFKKKKKKISDKLMQTNKWRSLHD